MTVVYYVTDGDHLLISTMAARGKPRAVERDGRVSLCVLDESWPVTYLQVYGQAVVERDHELAVDVLTRVIALMADQPSPADRADGRRRAAGGDQGHPLRDVRDPAAPRLADERHRHPHAPHQHVH